MAVGEEKFRASFCVTDGREVEAKKAVPREESTTQPSMPVTKKVFLGGLSLDTTEEEIRAILENYGPVSKPLQ